MKRPVIFTFLVLCFSAAASFSQVATPPLDNIVKVNLSQTEIDRIVKQVTKNESLFRRALNVYAFDRSASMQTIGMGGYVTGTYRRDSFMTFSDAGERFEKVVFAPLSTLTDLQVTAEDIDQMGGINQFSIEPNVADQYQFTLVGKEKRPPFDFYVFDVAPKVMPDPKKGEGKFFQGRIWVDADDLLIVVSKGKGVPELKQRFPIVETTRAPVDNRFYFPVDARSDDTLEFKNGRVQKIKFRVRYENYRLGRSDVRILDDVPDPIPSPTPKKPE